MTIEPEDNSPRKILGDMELIQGEYDRGRSMAQDDFARGQGKMYVQTRGAWGRFLFDLMQERYGIFVEHTSDIVWAKKLSFEMGYNEVAHEHVDSVTGPGSMDRIWEEVNAFRKASYRKFFDENPDIERPKYYR